MADPTGGLARRAGYASQYQQKTNHPVLHLDSGNYFEPDGPNSDLINQLMAESLRQFPVRVLNLTAGDLPYWSEQLARDRKLPTAFVSVNLVPLQAGAPTPKPYESLRWAAQDLGLQKDFHLTVTGVAVPQRIKPHSGFAALDPVEAVGRLDAEFWESQLQVLLTDLSHREVTRIIESHPEIDIVIRGERRFVLEEPKKLGNTWLLTAVERGRSLGQVELTLSPAGELQSIQGDLIEMGGNIPVDPILATAEQQLLEKLP